MVLNVRKPNNLFLYEILILTSLVNKFNLNRKKTIF